MVIAGYLASVFIGISLGLIGGGGSILTVPVLAYLFSIDAVLATTYSLFVVGATSLVGSLSYYRKGLVSHKTAVVFGLPSIVAVFATRAWLLPLIPDNISSVGSLTITKNTMLMLLFAVLMVVASNSMIRQGGSDTGAESGRPVAGYSVLLVQGVFVGIVTGIVGAGGGFLIIPALVNFLRLQMKTAVGTSLVIIAANSLAGFIFSVGRTHVQWQLLLIVTGLAVAGVLVGSFLSSYIDGKKLKPAFGWFVLAMGIYILIRELFIK